MRATTTSPRARRPHLCPALTLAAALTLIPRVAHPQAPPTAPTSAQQLEQLTAVQQAALDSGDSASVLSSSRQLASFANRLLGTLDLEAGDPRAAADSLARAWQLEPSPDLAAALITADLFAGRSPHASEIANAVISTSGDTVPVRLALAGAFHSADDLNGTIAQLTRAVALDPTFAPAHLALGNAFWELNEHGYNVDSLREFTEAQRLSPSDFFTNFDLGTLLSQFHRFTEAQQFLARAAAADPASPDPWFQLGFDAFAQNNFADARSHLEKALALSTAQAAPPNSPVLLRANAVLNRIHAEAGKAEQAARYAARADALHAQIVQAGGSGTLSESTGVTTNLPAGPARNRRPASNAGPSPAAAANNAPLRQQLLTIIAHSLNDAGTALARGRDYAGALPLFREAASADPALAPATRNLGLAAFHLNLFDEAIPALTRALEQNPGDGLVRSYLEQARAAHPAPAAPPSR